MRIICPMCGYVREVDETRIPPRAQMATCPKCSHKFRFRVVDDLTPAPPSVTGTFPTGQDLSVAPSDPLAAQRAAAGQAWRRLQGQPKSRPDQPDDADPSAGADPSGQPGQLGTSAPVPPPAALDAPASSEVGNSAGAEAREAPLSPVPFENLRRIGFFPGMWETIRVVLTKPAVFFRTMPMRAGMGKPLAFHLLLAEFMVVCQYLWGLAGIGATAEYFGSRQIMDMGLGLAQAAPIMLFIVYPLLLVVRIMVMTGVIHLLLRMGRCADSGAEATFRVLCYSAAPLVLGVIPGIGSLAGGVWSIWLTVVGLKEAHRTRYSASLFAVLVPILMLLAALLGLLQGMSKV